MATQTLPEGVSILPAELKRIADAMDALAKDHHAPRQLSVSVSLHVHHEYPKAIQISEKETVIVNDAAEELDAIEQQLQAAKDAEPAQSAPAQAQQAAAPQAASGASQS